MTKLLMFSGNINKQKLWISYRYSVWYNDFGAWWENHNWVWKNTMLYRTWIQIEGILEF